MHLRNTIELRVGGFTKAEILERLTEQSVLLNDYARVLFADPAFKTSTEPRDVRLVVVSLPNIGLPEGGNFDDILTKAAHSGLQPCALEIAPHLRLHYIDQPEGPYLTVASLELRPNDPLTPNGFYLRNLDGRLWLRGYESGPENIYPADFTDFVFVYPES